MTAPLDDRAHRYAPTGLPDVEDCQVRHPETGERCLWPVGHTGPHYRIGSERFLAFEVQP